MRKTGSFRKEPLNIIPIPSFMITQEMLRSLQVAIDQLWGKNNEEYEKNLNELLAILSSIAER